MVRSGQARLGHLRSGQVGLCQVKSFPSLNPNGRNVYIITLVGAKRLKLSGNKNHIKEPYSKLFYHCVSSPHLLTNLFCPYSMQIS